MTLSDAPATDKCQCTRAKGDYEIEGELGTTVICPDCHLEEATFREPDNAEQADFISERDVYIAFKGSLSLMKIAEKHPSDQLIKKAVRKREKSQEAVRDLTRNYGISSVVDTIRILLDDNVFTCTDAARCRFPDLFPEEQESQALDSEYNPSKETADGFEGSGLQNSQHGQTLQDCRLLASLPIRPRQRLMSQLQLILEHACFAFGQRTMQKDLDDWGWTCAEAVPLQRWIDLFKQNRVLETENSIEKLSTLLSSVASIQDIAIQRLRVDLVGVNKLLSSAEEFVELLGTPMYQSAITPLQQQIKRGILTANRSAVSIQKVTDRKLAEIEAEREKLKRQEEEIEWYQNENLSKIQDSLERDIFAAMAQAKDTLPDI
ncbi:hypothetical protein FOXB_17406 [Fusarium oxysporum f. sp. conglutinans Fo5176]|uniref:Uncharacterized protein n=2 Tax=Fusarium oxysporum f. sp. conglutinans TaxID=100902 RepID=F9GFH2_FUSOF|nr:hypothetical protein FOXB_17406 [Fusarium oxysporum f. sp. conglutinans Fo5176]KAG6978461.1 hypothetical protein FocnCong_v011782 [Fusarium oxysporum f. sp. conglutinans]KAI8397318.1 hypothetical protein FOFC_20590 [Fusarium oxysporum]